MTVEGVFNSYIIELSLTAKKSTIAYFKTLAKNHILYKFGKRNIKKISENELIKYLAQEKHNNLKNPDQLLSSSTMYNITLLINSIWEYAFNKRILKNKTNISLPKIVTKTVEIFSQQDKNKLIEYLNNNLSNYTLPILMCLYTGIRLGEICALKWSEIDFNSKEIYINETVQRIKIFDTGKKKTILSIDTPKSKASIRIVPIPNILYDILLKFKSKNSYFIISNSSCLVDPRIIQKKYKAILKKANVIYKKFHALRHTFATDALNNGMNAKILSEILGHSNIYVTLRLYVHTSIEQKHIEMNKIYSHIGT